MSLAERIQRLQAERERRQKEREAQRPVLASPQRKYVGRRLPGVIPSVRSVPMATERSVPRKGKSHPLSWAYGVTTYKPDVNALTSRERQTGRRPPYRRLDLLPRALASLRACGFHAPMLFVDGENDPTSWRDEFKLEVVCRYPRIGAFGNWLLALGELYIRMPHADYYAIFQDDIVTSRNLRTYIESIEYPDKGYLNLYTFPKNHALSRGRTGFYPSNQKGLGALGLVFDREAALMVLSDPYMAKRPRDRQRGHKYIDGGVVDCLAQYGWQEYVHNPTLVQHTGSISTLLNPRWSPSPSFRGEEYDLLRLLQDEVSNAPQTAQAQVSSTTGPGEEGTSREEDS